MERGFGMDREDRKGERKLSRVYGIKCTCGATIVTGRKKRKVRCWKCKQMWLICADGYAMKIAPRKGGKRCKYVPGVTTNKYGICKKKYLCQYSEKCEMLDGTKVEIKPLGR